MNIHVSDRENLKVWTGENLERNNEGTNTNDLSDDTIKSDTI